jgi:hypothetical protein
MKKYVDIKSGINNIRTASEKELIARIFTTSESLTENVVECEDIQEVAEIFATTSDEYKIAEKYFSFINKYARSPRKISYAKIDLTGGKTYSQLFEEIYQASNNFATFVLLGLTDSTEIATLANYVALNYPSEFMMVVPVTSSNYSTIQAATANINGVSLELCGSDEDTGKFNFVLPMAITATTDYNKENGTVNYMYITDNNMAVVVDNDNTAEQYDEVKVNYYGRTQQAGQKLAFYQNGVLQGNYQDQNIYVNEIWLKDALTTKFLNYMLLTSNWYANKAGQAIGQGLVVDIIERAKLNGTITTEKEISEADKVYIYNVTADENAWRQIYQLGYYLITSITKVTINNQETYQFNYTLLYSKGDSIKKVEGQNILI